ncbi:MAG: DUF2334 domain-containing protein [Opitutaceae bacterium]|jgi:hypothetical protein
MTRPRAHLLAALFALLIPAAVAAPITLPNPGFEQEFADWTVYENDAPMSTATASAAHQGKLGLRIHDTDSKLGSSVESTPLPAVPGRSYRVSLYARSPGATNGCGVYLRFRNDLQRLIPTPTGTASIPAHASDWTALEFETVAPADAASIAVWIHSYSTTTGIWEVDDIQLAELDGPGGAPVASTAAATSVAASKPAAALAPLPPLPASPPVIVLKLDDLVSTRDGNVVPRWKRITDFALERKIKLSIGIIADSLEGDKPAYFSYIKDLQKTGLFEFWFHGYDHKAWKEGDRNVSEFQGPSYEQQKDHFVRSQVLARAKLGFSFTTFGSPFNVSDANTARVLAEDANIKVWLYGDRANPAGKTVLDRVGAVSIEQPLFVPNPAKFIEGYAKNAGGRRFYVLQGHPAQWDDARWAEFVKLVDYLLQNHIPVVTPTEAAAL